MKNPKGIENTGKTEGNKLNWMQEKAGKQHKNLASGGKKNVYRPMDRQMHIFDYTLEDTFKLDPNNRWVKRGQLVPWELAEEKYKHMFRKHGRPSKDIRMALGALLIQEYLKSSDEETVQSITEQPYLQHFIGLKKYTNQPPFDSTLMVWFRKRLSANFMREINEAMCREAAQPEKEKEAEDEDDEPHGGTLIVDATCAPADIAYPTDTGLLAEAIENTDAMIDTMQEPLKGKKPRPRTYRVKSREAFTAFVKQRKPNKKTIRKCKAKQLNFLKRNLSMIRKMKETGSILTQRQQQRLDVIQTLLEQQREMYQNRSPRVDDRIVSLSQPHIRPIVRGKAGTPVEFGAKVQISVVNGYVFVEHISYDSFYEGDQLKDAILNYYDRFGMLPSRILADQAFTSRDNRKLCKELGIKLMGKPLGRPPKNPQPVCMNAGQRSEVEGKFGTLKTRYRWNRVMARLPETGKTSITLAAFAMNLAKRAKSLLRQFKSWFSCSHFGDSLAAWFLCPFIR